MTLTLSAGFDVDRTISTIRLLQARLATVADGADRETSFAIGELFPLRSICLYHYLLGDAYLTLSKEDRSAQLLVRCDDAALRSLLQFRACVEIGQENLNSADRTRTINPLYRYFMHQNMRY